MRYVKIAMIVLISALLSGCNLINNQSEQPNQNMDRKLEFFDKELEFVQGVLIDKYSSGSDEGELLSLNKNLNLIYKVLKIEGNYRIVVQQNGEQVASSDDLNFVSPDFIKVADNIIYVLDSKLNQIILMDNAFKEIKRINLKKDDSSANVLDFEVLNGEMFYTLQTSMADSAHIFKVSPDGKIEIVGSQFMGYLSTYEGKLYAVSTQEYFEDDKFSGFRSGENSLFVLNQNNNLEKLYDFWSGYAPADFIIDDEQIFIFGGSSNSIDQFKFSNGEYVNSLAQLDEESNLRVRMVKVDSNFFVFLPNKKSVWFIGRE